MFEGMMKDPAGTLSNACSAILIDDVFQMKAQGGHVDGAVVEDGVGDCRGASSSHFALHLKLINFFDWNIEYGEIGAFDNLGVGHQAHGPAGVIVGAQVGIGIVLLLEQDLGQAPVRLITLDDQ